MRSPVRPRSGGRGSYAVMYPCSLRRRASWVPSLDAGTSTVSCEAEIALRMRVRTSAMGSVIDIRGSPTRLRHPGHVAVVGQFAQADAARSEERRVGKECKCGG